MPEHHKSGKHRGIEWDEQPLGQMPDGHIADQLGCSESSVRRARVRRGVAAFRDQTLHERASATRARAIDWAAQPLGELTDAELARRLGVSRGAVTRQRLRRNIPALHAR